jgi:hypothetical protein
VTFDAISVAKTQKTAPQKPLQAAQKSPFPEKGAKPFELLLSAA